MTSMTPHHRFESLALTLPPAPKPVGVYKSCVVVGQHLHVSGHGPLRRGDARPGELEAWFAAGVFCVGMGSHLVDAETLKAGRFADLTDRARRLMAILAVR